MYFIDQAKIRKTLARLQTLLPLYRELEAAPKTPARELALERLVHVAIESVIDTGNSMIDGFIMRDPGSYEDIIDILLDESVIEPDMEQPIKQLLGMRKLLVRDFIDLDGAALARSMEQALPALARYPGCLTRYLDRELGPVSAFLPEEGK